MDKNIFRYILRHTFRSQIILGVLTVATLPLLYVSLEIPKLIINQALEGENVPETVLGMEVDRVSYLMLLSFAFLGLVILNGGLKYFVNVYRGMQGERMLRRLRYELYTRMQRFPLPHFKSTSPGEIIPMITAETEPLGGFIGDAFALPLLQGGILFTYLFFIFNQDVWLGLAAVALYPPQMWLVPKLQRRVNQLAKQRVQTVRRLADRIGEDVSGIAEIHASGTARLERADISRWLGTIYDIRIAIFRRKFFIKFLNNFLAQLTPFFFYSIGGYFVIRGSLSLGALVAVIAAYKDIAAPWKELLYFYQLKEDIKVKYAQIVEKFDNPQLIDDALIEAADDDARDMSGDLVSTNLVYSEDDVVRAVDGVNLRATRASHLAVVGPGGSGKEELLMLLARLLFPSGGRISIGEQSLSEIPETLLGRRLAYVPANAFMFSGTIMENLVYALKCRPPEVPGSVAEAARAKAKPVLESLRAGNSPYDIEADWIDYGLAGVEDAAALRRRLLELIDTVEAREDLLRIGLYQRVDPATHPELTARLLEARRRLYRHLEDPELAELVEFLDSNAYNRNLSVAANLLFGASTDPTLQPERMASNPHVLAVLQELDLTADFVRIGRQVADTMVELFADLPADSDLFERFSFISADDLQSFRSLLARTDGQSPADMAPADRDMLMALPFRLTVSRHRLGLIDEPMQQRLLQARQLLGERLVRHGVPVEFFSPEHINPALGIQENILFGEPTFGHARAQQRLGQLVRGVITELGLEDDVAGVALEFDVGTAGARLVPTLRQKLALVRALVRRPEVLIASDATAVLDAAAEKRIIESVRREMSNGIVLWALGRAGNAALFDVTVVMADGQVAAQGGFDELMKQGGALPQLVQPG